MSNANLSIHGHLGGLQRRCSTFLGMLAVPYGWTVRLRIWLYRSGWLPEHRLPCPVVSVGNVTVGGTGKTPLVIWVAQWLTSHGKRVGILSRGYGRANERTFLLVSQGDGILAGTREAGDEPVLMAQQCPGVVVAVGADRYGLGQWVLKRFPVDCFVLDDGFQHLGLYRDVNVLLVDASDPDGLCHLLPRGKLREPLSGASRATAIMLTRVGLANNLPQIIHQLETAVGKGITPMTSHFVCRQLIHVVSGTTQSVSWVKGKRALMFCGIGNTASFQDLIKKLGVKVLDEMVFPDHVVYTEQDLAAIRRQCQRSGAEVLLTTEKDAVKIRPFLSCEEDVWAIRVEVQVDQGKDELERTLQEAVERKGLGSDTSRKPLRVAERGKV